MMNPNDKFYYQRKISKITGTIIRIIFLAFGIYCGILFMNTDNTSVGWQIAEIIGGIGIGSLFGVILYCLAKCIFSFIKGDVDF